MRFASLLLVSFLIAAPVQARLGETSKECDARYGPKWKPGLPLVPGLTDVRLYQKKDLYVEVTFLHEVAARILFYRVSDDAMDKDQLEGLLQANAGGGRWVTLESTPPQHFQCVDGSHPSALAAIRHTPKTFLDIYTPEFTAECKRLNDGKAQGERARYKDF